MPLLLFFSPIQIPFHWSPLEAKQCQGLFPLGSDVEVIQVIFFWDRSGLSVRWTSLILYLTAGQWPMVSPRPFDQKPVSSCHHLLRKCPPLSPSELELRIIQQNPLQGGADDPPQVSQFRIQATSQPESISTQPCQHHKHRTWIISYSTHISSWRFAF